MNAISERIRTILDKRGITQYKLAKMIEAPITTVNGWFSRNNVPRDNYMITLAEKLGVSPAYLRYGQVGDEHTVEDKNSERIPLITSIPADFPNSTGKWHGVFQLPGIKGQSFAIHMPDSSMSPGIKKGDLVIFKAYDGWSSIEQADYVIVKDALSKPTVRRWGVNATEQEILEASNADYGVEEIEDKSMIVGIVEEFWERKFQRGTQIS